MANPFVGFLLKSPANPSRSMTYAIRGRSERQSFWHTQSSGRRVDGDLGYQQLTFCFPLGCRYADQVVRRITTT